jgi:hypothetical protein
MKQDYECCILNYVHSGKVLRYNQYAIRSKYNPKDAEGAMGGKGHRDAASDRDSTRIFEAKYDPYISYTKTHKDNSTSFVLKPYAERQRLAALAPKDGVRPRPQRPDLEMPDAESRQVPVDSSSGLS